MRIGWSLLFASAGMATRIVAFSVSTVPASTKQLACPSAVTTTSHKAADTSGTTNDKIEFLIHKGRAKQMIMRSPAIAGLTLVENWNRNATQEMARAVDQMVKNNPILRGRVHSKRNQLWITTDLKESDTTTTKQDYFRILETPLDAPDFSKIQDPNERLALLQERILPRLDKCELTAAQISGKLPLFQVTLVLLPGNYAVYAMHCSHAVGDGFTFFQLVKELSMTASGLPIEHPIEWNCPAKATHEFSPPNASPRDAHVTYGPAMMLGALRNFPKLSSRKASFLLIQKNRVNAKKRALRATLNCTDLSANDIITSALCQACQSSDLFLFTENVRHNGGPIPLSAGGNFLVEVPVSKRTAVQPDQLRRVVRQHGEYEPNHLPIWPLVAGRTGRITSLASVAESSATFNHGPKILCTVPLASFIEQIPMDVGVIFRYDNEHWGVLHNFGQFDLHASPLLTELLGPN
jgi:hypothetical protein